MRPVNTLFSLFLIASAASAENVRFDPPNPTSETPVVAHVIGEFATCAPKSASVTRNGSLISIKIDPPNCPLTTDLVIVGFDLPVKLGTLSAGVYQVVATVGNLLAGDGTLIVQDANPPFSVTPNVTAFAGDQVTIAGKDVAVCATGPSPIVCGAVVKFGDVEATLVSVVPDQVVVRAPQHSAGAVDVTVSGKRSAASFYYLPNDRPPDAAFYEPVLFPVAFSGPGAYGSVWQTEIYLRNDNSFSLTQSRSSPFNACRLFECEFRLGPNTTWTTGLNTSIGFLDYIPRQAAPNVHFGILVRDLSRQAEALGTEIPVIREKDLFDHAFELLNVPGDPRFRVAVRIYDVASASLVRMTISPLSGEEILVATMPQLSATAPGYFQISDLVAKYPQLAGKGPLRIKIEPLSVGGPRTLWAFASITNNETQHVTTISPQ
jgi:IPT/TIG domain-containing protein